MFTRSRSLSLLVALAVIWTAALNATAQTKTPLTHESMWMMKRVGAPVPSPDGKWVAIVVPDSR